MVESAMFSPDGRQILTGSYDNTIRLWDIAPGEITQMSGHTYQVEQAEFSPDGERVVTASADKTARIWDAAKGDELVRLAGHEDFVDYASFSLDGKRVVTASHERTARIWDAATGEVLCILRGHTGRVMTAAFSPDGMRVVTASEDKAVRIWDAATGRQIMLLNGHELTTISAEFSPVGKRIVSASYDKTARVWDAATGRQIGTLAGHAAILQSANFSPDGRRVVTSSSDKTVRIWDAQSERQIAILEGKGPFTHAVFSPDGTRVLAVGGETVYIWDAKSGQETMRIRTFGDSVRRGMFSPDGRRIVMASYDKHPGIWDVRAEALDVQVRWAASAQFDVLSNSDRFQLGLPQIISLRHWPRDQSRCDQVAAAPYDPDRRAAGSLLEDISVDLALAACSGQDNKNDKSGRAVYEHGRALMASGDFPGAARDFEQAVARGYRAARVDLARLLSQSSHIPFDVPKALSLYAQAWDDGIRLAGFELAKLYERGIVGQDGREYLAADHSVASSWCRKAADAGEPNALAQLADEQSRLASESTQTGTDAHLLEAFQYYAAAAERARIEEWPDDAWKKWRYYRASFARVLARKGMMREVADEYDAARMPKGGN